jgi:hypothetical protein
MRSHLDAPHPLDREVAELAATEAPWRRAAVVPIIAVFAVQLVVGTIVIVSGLPRHGDETAGYALIAEVVLLLIVLACGRPLAIRTGGWAVALC